VNSTYFEVLAEFGEANIRLERVAPKYFGLSATEAKRRAPSQLRRRSIGTCGSSITGATLRSTKPSGSVRRIWPRHLRGSVNLCASTSIRRRSHTGPG
jgi:hypothetical protein